MMTEPSLPIPGIVGNVSVSRLQAYRQHLEEFKAHLQNKPTAQSRHVLRLKLFDELVFSPDRLEQFKSYMKVKSARYGHLAIFHVNKFTLVRSIWVLHFRIGIRGWIQPFFERLAGF